jgi:membrane protease YdiL (CAAX protease family)
MTNYTSDYANDSENELLGEPHPSIEYAPPRTPHIGHAIFFFAFALGTISAAQLAAIGIAHLMPAYHALPLSDLARHPRVTIFSSMIAYTVVLALSVLIFPVVWQRSFADGISWNAGAVHHKWRWLVPLGVALSLASAGCESFLSIPKKLPVDKFFASQADLWLVSILGTLLAPVFEEICFRGFLLPAIAIAWDWLALPRTPEARDRWRSTNTLSSTGLLVGTVLTSIAFAALHGKQLSFTLGPLVVLFFVSLALCAVRIRLRSVAASSLVHASYNGFLFVITFLSTDGYRHLAKLSR